MEVRNDFTKGTMAGNIIRMAIPATLAQLINVLYNIVDRMYLGHIPGEGRLILTGVGVAFPVITIINAFANLCLTGGAPLCSIERGRGELEHAERIMGNAMSLLLLFGVILTAVGFLFRIPLLYAFGASDQTINYANEYLTIYLFGNIFVMIGLGMNGFINAQGFAKTGMMTTMIGAVLNLILDPVFIFTLNMGVKGAALATVLSQCVSAVWVLKFLTGQRAILRLRISNLRLKKELIQNIVSLGLAGFMVNFTNSLVQIMCNASLQFYGGDLYVGAMTIIFSIREVIQLPIYSVSQAMQPVLGYNYGAKENGRVKDGIQFSLKFALIYSLASWAVVMAFPQFVIRIFNGEAELLAVTVHSLRLHLCLFFFMAFQFTGQSVFTGLGKAKQAVFFSLFRKAILGVPLILGLPYLWNLGVTGVLIAEPITNVVGGLACYLTMMATVWKKL